VLRLVYALSLAALGLLIIGTLTSPVLLPLLRPPEASLPETARVQLLERPDEWVLQYNLLNDGPHAAVFSHEVSFDGQLQRATPLLEPGHAYQFVSHVPKAQLTTGEVRFTVTRAGDAEPLEDLRFHLGSAAAAPGQPADSEATS
jgi:hypothetical protein